MNEQTREEQPLTALDACCEATQHLRAVNVLLTGATANTSKIHAFRLAFLAHMTRFVGEELCNVMSALEGEPTTEAERIAEEVVDLLEERLRTFVGRKS